MARVSVCEKTGVKRGTWTAEEDRLLTAYIRRHGHWNWRELPKYAGLSRCGKSCRLRWLNYLQPNIKRGNYTKEEEELIIKLHDELGNRWSAIAASLPGRTDNEIKNHWHTHLRKQKKENTREQTSKPNEFISSKKREPVQNSSQPAILSCPILESSNVLAASTTKSSDFSCPTFISEFAGLGVQAVADESEVSSNAFMEFDENFWTDIQLVEGSYMVNGHSSQQSHGSLDAVIESDELFSTAEVFSVKESSMEGSRIVKTDILPNPVILGVGEDYWTETSLFSDLYTVDNTSEINDMLSSPVLEFDENFWTRPFEMEKVTTPMYNTSFLVEPSFQFSVRATGEALCLDGFYDSHDS